MGRLAAGRDVSYRVFEAGDEFDVPHSPTEDGIMELDDFLAEGEWPEVAPDFALAEAEYRLAAERVERHYAGVFGRRA